MKTLIVLVAMLLGALVHGQSEKVGSISATVPNVTSNNGEVLFAMYTEDNFMKTPQFTAKAEIIDGKATGVFENVPEGMYAIVVLHDENSNGKMDFGPGGMPQESYGTSNNSLIYGPPTWGDSNFEYDGAEKQIEIRF